MYLEIRDEKSKVHCEMSAKCAFLRRVVHRLGYTCEVTCPPVPGWLPAEDAETLRKTGGRRTCFRAHHTFAIFAKYTLTARTIVAAYTNDCGVKFVRLRSPRRSWLYGIVARQQKWGLY
ncbi:hypothetical protein E2C01_050600 [Portunus trituberculatus]|uniref:Uncharacterized protein n=1 Tax=Portunus trituberculatus TaxID=210409 RepID=A0A5B7GGF4_PORTR|nr:hypothetical protein [Portunus trituberculatus]